METQRIQEPKDLQDRQVHREFKDLLFGQVLQVHQEQQVRRDSQVWLDLQRIQEQQEPKDSQDLQEHREFKDLPSGQVLQERRE
jgi:hypothetical protein